MFLGKLFAEPFLHTQFTLAHLKQNSKSKARQALQFKMYKQQHPKSIFRVGFHSGLLFKVELLDIFSCFVSRTTDSQTLNTNNIYWSQKQQSQHH